MSSRYTDNRENERINKQPKWFRLFGIIFAVVLVIALICAGVFYYFGHSLISLTNFVSEQDTAIVKEEDLPEEARETVAEEDRKGTVLNESELDQLHDRMSAVDTKIQTVSNEDVYNFVLVGVDRRDKSWNGNSDSMMLVSINFKKERISIISIMRDTYVDIPEVGYNKLNNSYARGGGKLLCATITNNFNIDVSRYAAVDFENMIDIIDALGGIDIEWTDAEIEVANGYIRDMCDTLGVDAWDHLLPLGGNWHCDGIQAVAYARNRFVGNSDYARTERQRYVIGQIVKEVQKMNVPQLMSFARKVLPLITHNIKETDIWELITKAPAILNYSFVKDRVPYDGLYTTINVGNEDMLSPDWEQTILQMHETIYGEGTVSNNDDNDEANRTKKNMEFTDEFNSMTGNSGQKAGENARQG